MPSLNKSQKMVKMLELMSRRDGVRAADLMERFHLDARTLRRYLADLRELHIPVHDDGRGAGRVVAIDPIWRRTGVKLSLTELLSLHFGRTLFDFLEGTSFAQDMDDALERLHPTVSRSHADLAEQLDTKFIAVPEPAKDFGDFSDVLDEAITALLYNHPVMGQYRKVSGVEKSYQLHPYTLATYRRGLYLFALDVREQRVKTFALERFVELLRQRQHKFTPPRGWSPHAHLAHAFGIISGDPEDVALAFSESAGRYIRERTWHPTQTYRTLRDGRLELRLRVAVTVELRTWILSFGEECEVLGPPVLVDAIGRSLRAAAARYPEPQ